MLVLVATAVPLAGAGKGSNKPSSTPSYVDAYLTGMAENHPNTLVKAIIQSTEGVGEAKDAFKHAGRMDKPEGVEDSYKFISSVAVTVKARRFWSSRRSRADDHARLNGRALLCSELEPAVADCIGRPPVLVGRRDHDGEHAGDRDRRLRHRQEPE